MKYSDYQACKEIAEEEISRETIGWKGYCVILLIIQLLLGKEDFVISRIRIKSTVCDIRHITISLQEYWIKLTPPPPKYQNVGTFLKSNRQIVEIVQIDTPKTQEEFEDTKGAIIID